VPTFLSVIRAGFCDFKFLVALLIGCLLLIYSIADPYKNCSEPPILYFLVELVLPPFIALNLLLHRIYTAVLCVG
jgi:hypothetical protein